MKRHQITILLLFVCFGMQAADFADFYQTGLTTRGTFSPNDAHRYKGNLGDNNNPNPKPPHNPPAQADYSITVNAKESDAKVYIDGTIMGLTNKTFKIKPGRHNILVTKDGFEDYTTSVFIDGNKTIEAKLRRKSPHGDKPHKTPPPKPQNFDINVSCNIPDARVFIDGKLSGNVNAHYSVSRGTHELRVIKDGFEDYVTQINADRNQKIEVTLRRLPPPRHDDNRGQRPNRR